MALSRALLPFFLVILRGSCSQVIESVKALKANNQLHPLEVYGIIDRDRRVPSEIQKLEWKSIFVLSVAEVESLFCVKEVLEIVSERLARNIHADFQAVCDAIFSRLRGELETQVSLQVASEIKFQLNVFDENQKGAEALKAELKSLVGRIDVDKIYSQKLNKLNKVITEKDFEGLLTLYNRKTLSLTVSEVIGLRNEGLRKMVIRLAKGDYREQVLAAMKKYFGNFAQYMA